ncbi:MAG TPA: SapC family protein [Burkholderiaceae bacterium]|jgi:hypothetical protein
MTTPLLYSNLTALDRVVHKNLKLRTDVSVASRVANQNSLFLAAVEFVEACKEFPIVFVRVGEAPKDGGKQAVAPLAVLGLKPGQNLFVKGDELVANYVPAYLRRYPFAMARLDPNSDQMAVCYDADWNGFSETEGNALFTEAGEPSEFLLNAKGFIENFENEVERTRLLCDQLMELGLLDDMRFDATLPGGETLAVDGFLAVDEKKLAALPDAKIVELTRNGIMSLIEMHRVSMTNMNRLAAKSAMS